MRENGLVARTSVATVIFAVISAVLQLGMATLTGTPISFVGTLVSGAAGGVVFAAIYYQLMRRRGVTN